MNQADKDNMAGILAIGFMLVVTVLGFASCTGKVPLI